MSRSVEVTFDFPDVTPDVANKLSEALARELRQELRDDGRRVDPQVVRTDATAQDFGTAVVLVLGTPAVIALANAIRDWVRRRPVKIRANGILISASLESGDVPRVLEALMKGSSGERKS